MEFLKWWLHFKRNTLRNSSFTAIYLPFRYPNKTKKTYMLPYIKVPMLADQHGIIYITSIQKLNLLKRGYQERFMIGTDD